MTQPARNLETFAAWQRCFDAFLAAHPGYAAADQDRQATLPLPSPQHWVTPTAWRAFLTYARAQGVMTAELARRCETVTRQWETQQHNRQQHEAP
jgi:hypothetical protein